MPTLVLPLSKDWRIWDLKDYVRHSKLCIIYMCVIHIHIILIHTYICAYVCVHIKAWFEFSRKIKIHLTAIWLSKYNYVKMIVYFCISYIVLLQSLFNNVLMCVCLSLSKMFKTHSNQSNLYNNLIFFNNLSKNETYKSTHFVCVKKFKNTGFKRLCKALNYVFIHNWKPICKLWNLGMNS